VLPCGSLCIKLFCQKQALPILYQKSFAKLLFCGWQFSIAYSAEKGKKRRLSACEKTKSRRGCFAAAALQK
jgi:hypothetical protein